MSGKIIIAALAIVLGSTALASAQTRKNPYQPGYRGNGYTYYAPGIRLFGPPGYDAFAPGYYDYVRRQRLWGGTPGDRDWWNWDRRP